MAQMAAWHHHTWRAPQGYVKPHAVGATLFCFLFSTFLFLSVASFLALT
jgi:hypothetical protein